MRPHVQRITHVGDAWRSVRTTAGSQQVAPAKWLVTPRDATFGIWGWFEGSDTKR
jgi:hypothetical protein